jgi:hypothetical protein
MNEYGGVGPWIRLHKSFLVRYAWKNCTSLPVFHNPTLTNRTSLIELIMSTPRNRSLVAQNTCRDGGQPPQGQPPQGQPLQGQPPQGQPPQGQPPQGQPLQGQPPQGQPVHNKWFQVFAPTCITKKPPSELAIGQSLSAVVLSYCYF